MIRDRRTSAPFQAIRNPAHHATGDWDPLTAFHHLVALSQVAHYVRDWKLETYSEPPQT